MPTNETTYRNVQVIYDRDHGRENEGWYVRYDECEADGTVRNARCDQGLDCLDPSTPEVAVAEAVRYLGGKVTAEEIEVIA